MTTAVNAPAAKSLPLGRTMLDPELFGALVGDVVTEHQVTPDLAGRIVDQTAVFLSVCAAAGDRLSPSVMVDWCWHAFMLRPAPYAAFCQKIAGELIDHVPDAPGTAADANAAALQSAIDAAKTSGYAVDLDVWTGAAANCGESGCGAGRPPAV